MLDPDRLTVDDFFAWQELVDGRYELVDGHIVMHPDYFDAQGLASPDNGHGLIVANVTLLLGPQLKAPCRLYIGAGAEVDRMNANIPDLAVSRGDKSTDKYLSAAQLVVEVSSPKTYRIDTGRKVGNYLSIKTLEAYVFVDRKLNAITLYRPDAGPQSFHEGVVPITTDVSLPLDEVFA